MSKGKRKKFDCVLTGGVLPPIEVSLWHDREKLKKRLAERDVEIELRKDCDGQTFTVDTGDGDIHFVLVEGIEKHELYDQLALLAHEATHVASRHFSSIGEEEPAEEEWAYAIEAVCSALFDMHLAWVKGRSKQ